MEIFTGSGQRRKWSAEAKAQMVAESYSGVETGCEVARRYGLAPTQLFTWRRLAKTIAPSFVPVLVEPCEPAPAARSESRRTGGDGGI